MKPYEEYRLEWMQSHGYSLSDLINQLEMYMADGEVDPQETLNDIFERWECDSGFNGTLWACYDEWLENEGNEYYDAHWR